MELSNISRQYSNKSSEHGYSGLKSEKEKIHEEFYGGIGISLNNAKRDSEILKKRISSSNHKKDITKQFHESLPSNSIHNDSSRSTSKDKIFTSEHEKSPLFITSSLHDDNS